MIYPLNAIVAGVLLLAGLVIVQCSKYLPDGSRAGRYAVTAGAVCLFIGGAICFAAD